MLKIYNPNSGSAESQVMYQEYSFEDAQKVIVKALEDKRIVINVNFSKRITDLNELKDGDIIRIFPMVGGG